MSLNFIQYAFLVLLIYFVFKNLLRLFQPHFLDKLKLNSYLFLTIEKVLLSLTLAIIFITKFDFQNLNRDAIISQEVIWISFILSVMAFIASLSIRSIVKGKCLDSNNHYIYNLSNFLLLFSLIQLFFIFSLSELFFIPEDSLKESPLANSIMYTLSLVATFFIYKDIVNLDFRYKLTLYISIILNLIVSTIILLDSEINPFKRTPIYTSYFIFLTFTLVIFVFKNFIHIIGVKVSLNRGKMPQKDSHAHEGNHKDQNYVSDLEKSYLLNETRKKKSGKKQKGTGQDMRVISLKSLYQGSNE